MLFWEYLSWCQRDRNICFLMTHTCNWPIVGLKWTGVKMLIFSIIFWISLILVTKLKSNAGCLVLMQNCTPAQTHSQTGQCPNMTPYCTSFLNKFHKHFHLWQSLSFSPSPSPRHTHRQKETVCAPSYITLVCNAEICKWLLKRTAGELSEWSSMYILSV